MKSQESAIYRGAKSELVAKFQQWHGKHARYSPYKVTLPTPTDTKPQTRTEALRSRFSPEYY